MTKSTPVFPFCLLTSGFMHHLLSLGLGGVKIAVRKLCPFSLMSLLVDPEGHFLLIKGMMNGHCYTFASIYAPNARIINFFSQILRTQENFRFWEGISTLP